MGRTELVRHVLRFDLDRNFPFSFQGMELFAFILLVTHTFFGTWPGVLVSSVRLSLGKSIRFNLIIHPNRKPQTTALANMTSFECAKGPERVWYLRGTRDCDLPFSQVGGVVRTTQFPSAALTATLIDLLNSIKQGWVGNLQVFCCLLDGAWATLVGRRWAPKHWQRQPIVRDSADVCEHPWTNQYYTCC